MEGRQRKKRPIYYLLETIGLSEAIGTSVNGEVLPWAGWVLIRGSRPRSAAQGDQAGKSVDCGSAGAAAEPLRLHQERSGVPKAK